MNPSLRSCPIPNPLKKRKKNHHNYEPSQCCTIIYNTACKHLLQDDFLVTNGVLLMSKNVTKEVKLITFNYLDFCQLKMLKTKPWLRSLFNLMKESFTCDSLFKEYIYHRWNNIQLGSTFIDWKSLTCCVEKLITLPARYFFCLEIMWRNLEPTFRLWNKQRGMWAHIFTQ